MPSLKPLSWLCQNQGSWCHCCAICCHREKLHSPFGFSPFKSARSVPMLPKTTHMHSESPLRGTHVARSLTHFPSKLSYQATRGTLQTQTHRLLQCKKRGYPRKPQVNSQMLAHLLAQFWLILRTHPLLQSRGLGRSVLHLHPQGSPSQVSPS